MLTLEIICPFCGNFHVVTVTEESWIDYTNGVLVQDAFPYLSTTEREQIISQLCPTCIERTFKEA